MKRRVLAEGFFCMARLQFVAGPCICTFCLEQPLECIRVQVIPAKRRKKP